MSGKVCFDLTKIRPINLFRNGFSTSIDKLDERNVIIKYWEPNHIRAEINGEHINPTLKDRDVADHIMGRKQYHVELELKNSFKITDFQKKLFEQHYIYNALKTSNVKIEEHVHFPGSAVKEYKTLEYTDLNTYCDISASPELWLKGDKWLKCGIFSPIFYSGINMILATTSYSAFFGKVDNPREKAKDLGFTLNSWDWNQSPILKYGNLIIDENNFTLCRDLYLLASDTKRTSFNAV